jgi:hypothetical protein
MGVVLAAIIAFSDGGAPLALVGSGFATLSLWLGGGVFVLVLIALYRWIARAGARAIV